MGLAWGATLIRPSGTFSRQREKGVLAVNYLYTDK